MRKKTYLQDFQNYLRPLWRNSNLIKKPFVAGESIRAGHDWQAQVDSALRNAKVFFFLVDMDFVSSEFCQYEMDVALDRHRRGLCVIFFIFMTHVDMENPCFGTIQALPTGGRPITSWNPQANGWANVIGNIRRELTDGHVHSTPPSYNTLYTYADVRHGINNALATAGHVQLLSRSLLGWWSDYSEQFERIAKKRRARDPRPRLRFLVTDPSSDVFRSLARYEWTSTVFTRSEKLQEYVRNARNHVREISRKPGVSLRKTKRTFPFKMLWIGSGHRRSREDVIYVEFPGFEKGYQRQLYMCIDPSDREWFDGYRGAFERLWK